MKTIRNRTLLVAFVTVLALYLSVPTIIYFLQPPEVRNDAELLDKKIPSFFPRTHINLGLDLQGGVQLVLGVRLDQAIDNKLGRIGTEITRWSSDEGLAVKTAFVPKDQTGRLRVELADGTNADQFIDKLRPKFPDLQKVDQKGNFLDFSFRAEQIKTIKASAIEQAERVIRNRVDKWGVTEPLISRRADGTVLVQLPGFKDPEKAKDLLGRTAQLKFKIVDDEFTAFNELAGKLPPEITATRVGAGTVLTSENKQAVIDATKGLVPPDHELLFGQELLAGGKKTRYTSYVVHASTELQGDDVTDAFVSQDNSGLDHRPEVSLKFSSIGGKRFEEITGKNVQKRMAIILDDVVESAPTIQGRIGGGTARITLGGNRDFNKQVEEANQLSLVLKSGALPATIDILEQRQVGASLGPELATQGILGTALGLVLVYIFMIGYYRRPGMIACAALVLNAIYVFACMAGFGFALTLPGIAGFVLGLGMAVDANVLINERIRQELREGKAPKKALEIGFGKVFWTVFDSHVTTMIAAFILLETNTSGPVRGFAVTLIIGLIVSLFTSLYCSHLFFDIVMQRVPDPAKELQWLGGKVATKNRNFHFDFLKHDMMTSGIAVVGILAVLAFGAVKGFNWSVDFVGGLEAEVVFKDKIPVGELRETLSRAGVKDAHIQALGGGEQEFLLRLDKDSLEGVKTGRATPDANLTVEAAQAADAVESGAKVQALQDIIKKELASHEPKITRVDYVGPQIGKELRNQGFMSLIYAIIGVLAYLAFRFDLRFGSGAVLKLIPDTCAMLAFYLVFWRSFDLTSIAALLTGIGYSVNDVIVVFDRIRENLAHHPSRSFRENINISLNETLSRTINTSVVTSLSLVGLLVFGTGSIWNFAAAMTVGILGATLTSNFVGSSYLLWFDTLRAKFTRLTASKST